MKQFAYKAKTIDGKNVSGLIESLSVERAVRLLQERKLIVLDISEQRFVNWKNLLVWLGRGVSEREVATFTRMLATMMATGLPLVDALTNLITQTKNGYFREIIQSILHDVQSGISLSASMSRFPKVFSELYINLVKAGEASGKVDDTLKRLADTLEANLDFKSRVRGAMVYPAFIIVVMTAIGIFMITNIIPKVAEVYREFGEELPLPTRVFIGISDLIRYYGLFVLLLIIGGYFSIKSLRKNPLSDQMINDTMFKFPVMGEINTEVILSILCRTLGTLLGSGVTILEALKIVSRVVGNNYFRAGLVEAAGFVEKGLPLSVALRRNPRFPLMVSQLVTIGEETGTLDQSLERLANFYQSNAEQKVKTLTTLLEPMLILLMGGMVAGLALAVLLPMFNLVNVIR